MPLNFPNTWGIRKDWSQTRLPHDREDEPEEDTEEVYDEATGKMKCPRCDSWVRCFNIAEGRTEYGCIDASGDIDYGDSDSTGDFEITCPECGHTVFDSSTSKLVDYYDTHRHRRRR